VVSREELAIVPLLYDVPSVLVEGADFQLTSDDSLLQLPFELVLRLHL